MFSKLKKKKMIANFMNFANITTTVPKKGSRILLKNERGIFRVSVVRSILMCLVYEMKYPDIDKKKCLTARWVAERERAARIIYLF